MLRIMSELNEVSNPLTLRALAHPSRVRLLEELVMIGPATATELAERVGESPANCSWHLRQLALHGFVEEAGGGRGRKRPWRLVARVSEWGRDDSHGELNVVGDAVARMLLDREVVALREWMAWRRHDDPRWRSAATFNHSLTWLTVEELAELNAQITQLLGRYVDRFDPGRRPAGARPVRIAAWGVPARPQQEGQDDA